MKLPRRTENLIAEFRGLPLNYSRSIDRASVPLDSLIEVLTERYQIGKLTPEETLMSNWKNILGDNAHRCSPIRIDNNGVLVVSVGNPIVKRELLFQQKRYLEAIRALEGCGHIQEIRFIAG